MTNATPQSGEYKTPLDAPAPADLIAEIRWVKSYYPCRIVWGYMNDEGKPEVWANPTRRQMNAEARTGRVVYTLEPRK